MLLGNDTARWFTITFGGESNRIKTDILTPGKIEYKRRGVVFTDYVKVIPIYLRQKLFSRNNHGNVRYCAARTGLAI